MVTDRETSATPVTDRWDDERLVDESEGDTGLDEPLDAAIETPIEDAIEQRAEVPLDDDEHDDL